MRYMTPGRQNGKPYCELLVTPEVFKVIVKGAGDNPNSPCQEGTYSEVARHASLAGHQLIGHFATGKRRTCSPTSALGIARAVGWPFDALFVTKVSVLAVRPVRRQRTKVAA